MCRCAGTSLDSPQPGTDTRPWSGAEPGPGPGHQNLFTRASSHHQQPGSGAGKHEEADSLSVTHHHQISSLSTYPRKAWHDAGAGVAGPMFGVTQSRGVTVS